MKYDIIGDIHGHAYELVLLLNKMGYSMSEKGHYYHPDRQAIFVGDYIDRGPNSKDVYRIVRGMVDNESAIALMGNHEYNAILFHTKKQNNGGYYREHDIKNINQHYSTLTSFNCEKELNKAISWFKQLPLYYENEYFRVVHACWDSEKIDAINHHFGGEFLLDELIELYTKEDSTLFKAIETVLKGMELKLNDEISFLDKDGHKRKEIRVKWWEDPEGKTYKEYAVNKFDAATEEKINKPIPLDIKKPFIYPSNEKPVFFGHYWLEGKVKLQTPNVCCLDYSVAKQGDLVAYRFDGEKELDEKKFVCLKTIR